MRRTLSTVQDNFSLISATSVRDVSHIWRRQVVDYMGSMAFLRMGRHVHLSVSL